MESHTTREPLSNAVIEINHALLISFVEAIARNEFCAHFKIGKLNLKQFLK